MYVYIYIYTCAFGGLVGLQFSDVLGVWLRP